MGDVTALRDSLELLAVKYEGREFTPQLIEELRSEVDQLIKSVSNEVFYVNDKHQTLEGVEILPQAGGSIKLLLTWYPTLYHQSYREVKNFIHNTIGLNEKSFMNLVEIEIEKIFKKLEESGELEELFQKQIYKYLGSYKSGLPGHHGYNNQFRLKELISENIAKQVADMFQVFVTLKGEK